jgi:DNA-binding transcriptional LysR family regulator
VQAERFTIAFVTGVTLTRWTTAWEQRHPQLALAFIATTAEDQVSVLKAGSADVAFVRLPVTAEGLSVIPLYEETAVVVVPKDHAIAAVASVTVADLEAEDLVDAALIPADAVELVAAGAGVVMLPQSIARQAARKDVVARPVTDAPTTRIALAWRADATTPEIEQFVGIVRGRTANSSRSPQEPEPEAPAIPRQPKPKQKAITGRTRPKASRSRKPRRR